MSEATNSPSRIDAIIHSANDPTDGSVIFAAFAFKLGSTEEAHGGWRGLNSTFVSALTLAAFSRSVMKLVVIHHQSFACERVGIKTNVYRTMTYNSCPCWGEPRRS